MPNSREFRKFEILQIYGRLIVIYTESWANGEVWELHVKCMAIFPTESCFKYFGYKVLLPSMAIWPGFAEVCLRLGCSSLSAALKLCLPQLCSVPSIYPTWNKITTGYDICAYSLDLK